QKNLEQKIATEKNKKEKIKLEIYHTFFLNNEFDKKQGTIKEKTCEKEPNALACGPNEIK
ncbi:15029_t:CDS:1, partial [Racocetra persica]